MSLIIYIYLFPTVLRTQSYEDCSPLRFFVPPGQQLLLPELIQFHC